MGNVQQIGHIMKQLQLIDQSRRKHHVCGKLYAIERREALTYAYGYDVAGNLINNNGTARTFNKLNQLSASGFTYDANGNLLTDNDSNTYTWDRANRLKNMGGVSYTYDGTGNRISRSVGSTLTRYLLDTQPGLAVVLSETTDMDTTHYIHGSRGIFAQYNPDLSLNYMLQDGLQSVRAVVTGTDIASQQDYTPYGEPVLADLPTTYGFTGEQTDSTNDLVYLRARYLNPSQGVFGSLDPFEGMADRAMSLNGYSWVEGNVINATDPNGERAGVVDCSNPSSLNDIDQLRCDYAKKLLNTYPSSGSISYWMRFSLSGLTSAWNKFVRGATNTAGEAPAIVPIGFIPVATEAGGDSMGALVQLRRMEERGLDRPLSFVEIFAIILSTEATTVLSDGVTFNPSYCMQQRGESDISIFKNLFREALERNFKGQCKNEETGIKGECGPDRLLSKTLGGIEGFYNSSSVFPDYPDWLGTASFLISRQDIYGYQCAGVSGATSNRPITWGNTPSPKFPNDPPEVGKENVIDWINLPTRGYKYFIVQGSSACPQTSSCGQTTVLPGLSTC